MKAVKVQAGVAFASAYWEAYDYNARGELTSSAWTPGACGPPLEPEDPNFSPSWVYDNAGNREEFIAGTTTPARRQTDYYANALNQVRNTTTAADGTVVAGEFFEYDADGNLRETGFLMDMNCDGVLDTYDIDGLIAAMAGEAQFNTWCASHCADPNCAFERADLNSDGIVDSYDIDYATGVTAAGQGGYRRWGAGAAGTIATAACSTAAQPRTVASNAAAEHWTSDGGPDGFDDAGTTRLPTRARAVHRRRPPTRMARHRPRANGGGAGVLAERGGGRWASAAGVVVGERCGRAGVGGRRGGERGGAASAGRVFARAGRRVR